MTKELNAAHKYKAYVFLYENIDKHARFLDGITSWNQDLSIKERVSKNTRYLYRVVFTRETKGGCTHTELTNLTSVMDYIKHHHRDKTIVVLDEKIGINNYQIF